MELTNILNTSIARNISAGMIAAALAACGASTTTQLADARRAYDEAESSPARTRAPNELAEARVALDRAEAAHNDNPGSDREVTLAERAERKAHLAEARGEARSDRAVAAEPARPVVVEAAPTRAERVEHVRETRSDRHADAALQSLAQVANVKEEPRGVVITLSGGLLFPSGDKDMSPIANQSLDQVAHALAQQPDNTTFDVEGYTDSSGSERENQALSAKRAQAVADRLAQAGIDGSRINVVGRGEDAPIADNATAEGRASNRRIEIVVARHREG